MQRGVGSSIRISQQSEPLGGAQQTHQPGNQISLTVEEGTQTSISQQGPGPQVIEVHPLPAAPANKAQRPRRPKGRD